MFSRLLHQEDDDGTRSNGGPNPNNTAHNPTSGDGATIEVVKRPRGRPPGSKNKSKPPVFVTPEPEPATMGPYILEIPSGSDVVEAITRFSRRKNTGLCVLTGSGIVDNVTLRQPSTALGAGTAVIFQGRFEILSISATFLPQQSPAMVPNGLSISLSGQQGQIIGGRVADRLIAAGTVYVIAASFNNPSYHRLPSSEEVELRSVSGSVEELSPPFSGGGGDSSRVTAGSCGLSMYSCQLPPDVIWAPIARPPPSAPF